MGLRSGSRRRLDQEAGAQPQGVLGRLGAVRQAQQITTYGVGSMVAIGDQSFLVSGLDSWHMGSDFDIREPRLESDLGVRGIHLPPASDPPAGDGVRVRRFPITYSCQECGTLKPYSGFNSPKGRGYCGQCDRTTTPPVSSWRAQRATWPSSPTGSGPIGASTPQLADRASDAGCS